MDKQDDVFGQHYCANFSIFGAYAEDGNAHELATHMQGRNTYGHKVVHDN